MDASSMDDGVFGVGSIERFSASVHPCTHSVSKGVVVLQVISDHFYCPNELLSKDLWRIRMVLVHEHPKLWWSWLVTVPTTKFGTVEPCGMDFDQKPVWAWNSRFWVGLSEREAGTGR